MPDVTKLKQRSTLGEPPFFEEASGNLRQLETAPTHPPVVNGRTVRRKGRTKQFNVRVTPDFHCQMFGLIAAEDRPAVDILEAVLALYEARDRGLRKPK